MVEADTMIGKVRRSPENKNSFPMWLVMYVTERTPGDPSYLMLAEIDATGQAQVIGVNRNDKNNVFYKEATPEQVKLMADTAFRDLGVVHPGVAALLNYAEDIRA